MRWLTRLEGYNVPEIIRILYYGAHSKAYDIALYLKRLNSLLPSLVI